ncbi:Hybrid signal transduction histidine kinase D [Durusdinium trenchii]|uniref:histidine kinase n=1 Tax=Durusdinium trenchii TaxID=1381693 RepID=A0ABP0RES9_9DINO
MSYTVSDVVAKLTHSAILVSMRRRRNLMILDELRVAAQLAAMDIQRLISQANVPIFCVNKNLEVEEWNQKIEELTGVKKVDALQRSLPEFCSERASGWWASAEKLLRDALEGLDSSVVEMHMTGAPQNGQMAKSCMMAVSATSQRTRTGEIKGAVCIGQDVTELTSEKQKAENLAESLNRLIQSANAPIFEIDLEFNVIKWNSWLENRSALSQEELAGKSVFEVLSPETRKSLQDGVERALTAEQTPNDVFEVRLHNSMGQGTATLLLTATTCLAPTGQTSGVICIGQDITKLKDLDERKASMMAVVSHELKSPLHGILGLCNSLLEDDETPFQVKKPLSMMNSCTKRLLDMVSNIMDASVLVHDQKMRMSKDPVQIQTVVEEVITLSQQSSGEVGSHALSPGVHLINEVFAPLPVIEADRYRVTQMLYNLVTNAIKFTHKGSIIVSASADDERKMVKVDVRDTGIGIAQENIDRIFQPFDQEDSSDSRRYGGLGLGLSICREVAARHGGEISVESVRGQGSTFSVVLPYKMHSVSQEDQEESQIEGSTTSAPVPAERALTDNLSDKERTGFAARFNRAERSEKGQCASSDQGRFATVDLLQQQLKRLTPTDLLAVDNARPTILSVDDDPIHLQITHNMLVSQDYEVREAMNVAEAAADMVRKGIPSLILLDVMMPEMMGTELVKALRQNFGPELLPIVMVSAKGNKDTITSCLEMGANDYVQKPFQKKELLERIRFQLKLSGKARQTQKVNKRMEEENKTSESQGSLLNWKDINAKELRAAHEERDKAQQEASDLRRRVLELEELHRPHREEQKRLTQEFLKRQQVLLAHQEQLAACMEQLESFQAVQRSLLLVTDKATDPKVPLHLSTPLAVFAGHFTEGPVNESLRDVQTAEESLKCCLNRMIELSNSLLPGDAKEEMNSIVAVLNQDMSKVIMETGRKHYMLLDAQCKLQDQALQIQRILQPPRVVQQPRMSSHG